MTSRLGTPSEAGPTREPWIVTALHGLALAVTTIALLVEVALPAGIVGGAVGALVAVLAARMVGRSRVRLSTIWLAGTALAGLGLLVGGWIVGSFFLAGVLGAGTTMALGDCFRYGLLTCGVFLAVHATTVRIASFTAVEVALVGLALAGLVASHRDGAINQPQALSDWAWMTGRDPVDLLLYIGVATAIALVLVLVRGEPGRGRRLVLHLGAAAGLIALVLLLISVIGLPRPPEGGGGLSSRQGEGQGGGKGTETKGKGGSGGQGGGAGGRQGDQGGGGGGGGGEGNQGGGQSGDQSVSSFSSSSNQIEQLEFKDNSSSTNDTPVAVVVLRDDYSPPLGYYYFRQTAFSQFNGHRLVTRTRDDMDRDILADFPSKKTWVPDPPKAVLERKYLKSTVALLADHIHPFGLETPIAFEPRESPDPARFVRAYDVTSAALAIKYRELLGKRSFANSWPADLRRAYTELPDDPRYRRLADEIIDNTLRPEYRQDPFAQAIAISAWLGRFSTYSQRSQHESATDPTADFLFGDRIGYCVHFSHAAAYLLRARGLPARIAAGYAADEGRKGAGSTIMLRQKDAHAWAELYLEGFGWIIVDVSPERSLDPPDIPADRELQQMLGELARGEKPSAKPKHEAQEASKLPSAKQVGKGAGLVLGLLLLLLYAVKMWRRIAPYVAAPRSVYRLAYRAALDRLGEAGWRRSTGETRERFAVRLGGIAPTLTLLTREHVGAAFGSRRLARPGEVRRLAEQTASEAQGRARWWRLLLGTLNPISWTTTR